jgi:hypothetical protein
MKYFTLAAFAFALTTIASGQTLWQDATVGMSRSELEKLPKPLTEISIFSHKFDVSYQFKNDALTAVNLRYMGRLDQKEMDDFFVNLTSALTVKYGKRINEELSPTGPLDGRSYPVRTAVWHSTGIRVTLKILQLDNIAKVSVDYDTELDDEAKKL